MSNRLYPLLHQGQDAGTHNALYHFPLGVATRAQVRAWDAAGNVGQAEATFTVDDTPPTVTLALAEDSSYAHVDGDTLYYAENDGTFTVTAVLTDATSGLAQVTFPDTTGHGVAYTLDGETLTTTGHTYAFAPSSDFDTTVFVTATDRTGNEGTAAFTVVRDVTPPQVQLDVPSRVYTTAIPITWQAADAQSGVAWYDLDVRVNGGEWQRVLTHTQSSSYQYTGEPGSAYNFRVTATDNVGNAESAEAAASVVVVTRYYYHGGQRVAMRRSTASGSVVYYLHGDHLGSTSLTTYGSGPQAGEVVARHLYHPYGEVRWSEGTLPTDFGFTGQRGVPGTGLIFMHARYYHPALGRFVSADTIVPNPGNPQALNRYSYVLGNPLKYTDPSGHAVDPGGAWGSVEKKLPELPGAAWAASVVTQIESFAADHATSILASYQGLGIGISWFFELGKNRKYFGPDEPLTRDLRYDPAMERFYEAWAATGYELPFRWDEDSIDAKGDYVGSFIAYAIEHIEAVPALLGLGSIEGRIDTVGIALGSLDEVYVSDAGDNMVRVDVRNTSNWASFLRIPGMEDTFGIKIPLNIPRTAPGPGGNMYEYFWWEEPYPGP